MSMPEGRPETRAELRLQLDLMTASKEAWKARAIMLELVLAEVAEKVMPFQGGGG